MKKLYVLIAFTMTACQTNVPKTIERGNESISDAAPGTILHQSVRKIGNGFYDVSKSVVNSTEHWEGIGHFGYIYFGKTEICRCSESQTVRSPDGNYIAYYSNETKQLELYNTHTKQRSVLSEKYIGYPNSAAWNLKTGTANINLSQPNGSDPKELQITLN